MIPVAVISPGAHPIERQKENKVKAALLAFSDPTTTPIAKAAGKGAVGAWAGKVESGLS